MIANLDKIAQELYGKIQTRFPAIKIGDEQANVLSKKQDIPKARFFEFEYEEDGEALGVIAITLDANDGIIVQVSGDLVDDDSMSTHHGAFRFLRSFRQFAKHRLLKFDIQNIGKSNLDKRDYQFQAKSKEPNIMESKLFGTSRISYQDLGEARLIIRHNRPVNEEFSAGRSMYIESIYIENAQGERFKYPFKHLNGARAMAEHIKHGGTPYDDMGKYVIGLSEELSHLRKFKGFVNRQPMIAETMSPITDQVIERIEEIKKELTHLQRPKFYEEFIETFELSENIEIPENVINDLVDRLTVKTFNEELKSVFPYIYKFINETELPIREIDVDELIAEDARCPDCYKDPCECEDYDEQINNESFDPIMEFETFVEEIVCEDKNELFSPNKTAKLRAIDKLNKVFTSELRSGPNGINAIESIRGIIDDSDLNNEIRMLDPSLDARPIIQDFLINHSDRFSGSAAETLKLIKFGGEQAMQPTPEPEMPAPEMPEPEIPPEEMELPPEPAPMAPPAPGQPTPIPPVPPAPMAESFNSLKALRLKEKLMQACECGATLETILEFGHSAMTLQDAIEKCGYNVEEFGFNNPEGGINEMLKYVSGFYNKDEGNFPLGGERIKIKLKKEFEDGKFPAAQPEDVMKLMKFIDMKDQGSMAAPEITIEPMANPQELKLSELMSDIKRLAGI